MWLFIKLFFSSVLILVIAVIGTGVLMLEKTYQTSLKGEIENLREQAQLSSLALTNKLEEAAKQPKDPDKFFEEWGLDPELAEEYNYSLFLYENQEITNEIIARIGQEISTLFTESYSLLLYNKDGALVFQKNAASDEFKQVPSETEVLNEREHWIQIKNTIASDAGSLTLVLRKNTDDIHIQRAQLAASGSIFLFAIVLVSSGIMYLIIKTMTKSIGQLQKASQKLASGEYDQRVSISSKDEIGQLATSFNWMADKIEENVILLKEDAQKREDFIANFAHELKTPLTSIIGYADELYQNEMERSRQKEAAAYIVSEGMRLEAMSFKLLELIVNNKENFVFEEIKLDDMFSDLAKTVQKKMERTNIVFQIKAVSGYIKIEYDLFKTLMVNLLDNSMKSGANLVSLSAIMTGNNEVEICVADNGRGIPANDLCRITEAFYVVDKARSRSQNGSGLGLAIAKRVAELHQLDMRFQSVEGQGTTVSFFMRIED